MKIIWTRNAEERQEEWRKTLGITRQEVEDLLSDPGQGVQVTSRPSSLKREEEMAC